MSNSGWEWLHRRVTINLAPAHLRKEGSAFDPAITVGILATSGQISVCRGRHFILGGELSRLRTRARPYEPFRWKCRQSVTVICLPGSQRAPNSAFLGPLQFAKQCRQTEFSQLTSEIDRIASATVFNSQTLLTGFGNSVDPTSSAVSTSNLTGVNKITLSGAPA